MKKKILIKEAELKEIIHNALNDELSFIGQFGASHDLLEMARVGETNEGFEVYIRSKDNGNIPHVHVFKKNKQTTGNMQFFETCIQLNTNDYFLHDQYVDKLNAKERKDFMDFMCAKPLLVKEYNTNYEMAVSLWNNNNISNSYTKAEPQYEIVDGEEKVIVPDYRHMT